MIDSDVLFHALIRPHRSLSRRGLYAVMAIIASAVLLATLRFLFIGAWPVVPFGIGEIGLAIVLLAVNARRGRASELVVLTEREVAIIRTDPKGERAETRLSNAWLNVVLQERPGLVSRLVLAAHGMQEEIGAVLGEEQKRSLAKALEKAFWRMRNPVFDNPQLRDDPGAAA